MNYFFPNHHFPPATALAIDLAAIAILLTMIALVLAYAAVRIWRHLHQQAAQGQAVLPKAAPAPNSPADKRPISKRASVRTSGTCYSESVR